MVYVPVKLRELDLIEKKTRMTVSQKELIDEESEKMATSSLNLEELLVSHASHDSDLQMHALTQSSKYSV
jgi:hypothetical protein